MKPISADYALASVVPNNSLMVLNVGLLGIDYVKQLIALSNDNIKSIGGIGLSTELWIIILEFALVDTQNSFCFVQETSLQQSSTGLILHCRRIDLEGGPSCSNLDSPEAVKAFENFMKSPNDYYSLPFTAPSIQPGQGYRNTFNILITSAGGSLPVDSACLFNNITVPDIISHMEGGACSFCSGQRLFCPGCIRGREGKWDVSMGCGVELCCPLCIGVDFSWEHQSFLKRFDWEHPPEEEQKAVDDWLQERLDELGY